MQQLFYVVSHMGAGVGASRGNILEVGSGKGSNTIFLASLYKNTHFTGLDILEKHVEYSRAYATRAALDNVTFVQGDAALLPLAARCRLPSSRASAPLDLIFGIESFCHLDTDEQLTTFLEFAFTALKPGGKIVIIDGFRTKAATFSATDADVQQAMNLAENGFCISRMASKETWRTLGATAGFKVVDDIDLTSQAARFWTLGWRVAQLILMMPMPWPCHALLRAYFARNPESGGNFVAVVMTAYAMTFGAAEYGVVVLQKKQ
jgi:SAM-dependent methyltransferase